MTEPDDKKAILFDIDQTRSELGDTVDALSHKADVKARAGAKVADVKESVNTKVDGLKDGASTKVADVRETASSKVADVKDEVRVAKAQVIKHTPSTSDVSYKVRSLLRDKRVRSAFVAAVSPIVYKLIRSSKK